jgi:hypothetical protein
MVRAKLRILSVHTDHLGGSAPDVGEDHDHWVHAREHLLESRGSGCYRRGYGRGDL